MRRSRVLWRNPGNPPDSVSRALGLPPRRFGRALHKIKAASDLSGADRVINTATGPSPMGTASRLATSSTKTDPQTDRKAFVTLRFAGDDLDPAEISAILPIVPTRAHRKGEKFFAGPHAGRSSRPDRHLVSLDRQARPERRSRRSPGIRADPALSEAGGHSRIATLCEVLKQPFPRTHHLLLARRSGRGRRPFQTIPLAIEPLGANIETDFRFPKHCRVSWRPNPALPIETDFSPSSYAEHKQ